MGQLTNFTEKKVLDHILKMASYSPPATVYLGLSTADPLRRDQLGRPYLYRLRPQGHHLRGGWRPSHRPDRGGELRPLHRGFFDRGLVGPLG